MTKPIIRIIYCWAIVFIFCAPVSLTEAATARSRYLTADACHQKLLKNSGKQKYRDNWFRCIDAYLNAYKHEPSGPWAAAGLYQAAELYLGLYDISYRKADRENGLELFRKIVSNYPKSRYRARARKRLTALSPKQKTSKKQQTAKKATAKTIGGKPSQKGNFETAEACYHKLKSNEKLARYRDKWLDCIEQFQTAYARDTNGKYAPASMYMSGKLYGELHRRSYSMEDKFLGLEHLSQVTKKFPNSSYRSRAQAEFGKLVAFKIPESIKKQKPSQPPGVKTRETVVPVKGKTVIPSMAGHATVTQLRHWSNPEYTRVVVNADHQVSFTHGLLGKDTKNDKPPRLYVDLDNSRLDEDVDRRIPINDNLLQNIRAGQYTPTRVRVVVDIKSYTKYKVFYINDPFRIVIDIWGKGVPVQRKAGKPRVTTGPSSDPAKPADLARQFALGVKRIVIDPGHGGWDPGAKGFLKGIYEKDVALTISKRLASKLRTKYGFEVILTRQSDRYLELEERTAIANTRRADLFISIHTNAVKSSKAYGIETYFLNLATDEDAILLAARENATSRKTISDLQSILEELMQNAKINESGRLSRYIQSAMIGNLKKKYKNIKDNGVKQAPFYVLMGAHMPSILIETSFISNPRECKRLVSPQYREDLVDAIISGIQTYINKTSPTVLHPVKNGVGKSG